MIGVLTHHWAKVGQIEEARDLLNRNGAAQSQAPGFVERVTMYGREDVTQITTLVTWESNEIYDAWKASPQREAIMKDAPDLWSKPTVSDRFDVVG